MRRLIKLLFIIGIVGITLNLVKNRFIKPSDFISPVSNNITGNTPKPSKKIALSGLEKAIDAALDEHSGTYGIAVKNLKTSESYYLNEHRTFEAGSLYKLWVMAEVFDNLQKGTMTEDEILSHDVQALNNEFDISPENAELTDGTITLNVSDSLEQMITISHNYAAYLLTDRIKLPAISDFLTRNKFTESFVGEPPKATPYDISLFFEKLYKGQLANENNTKEMIDLLKRQTLNNKIPKYLPQNIEVAHKTGEIDYLSHDVGIVFTDKGDYIIVVLSESDFPPGAEERIGQISQAVYKYFMDKET